MDTKNFQYQIDYILGNILGIICINSRTISNESKAELTQFHNKSVNSLIISGLFQALFRSMWVKFQAI